MEPDVKIYHNPQCSKSREALEYLRSRPLQVEVVEYLKTPPTADELRKLVKMLGIAPSSLIRARDFQRLGLQPADQADGWFAMITEHPVILERPIVVAGDEARIGRPLENLFELAEAIEERSPQGRGEATSPDAGSTEGVTRSADPPCEENAHRAPATENLDRVAHPPGAGGP